MTDNDQAVPYAVAGAGRRGTSIALVIATAGYPVLLYDEDGAQLEAGLELVCQRLAKRVQRGALNHEAAEAIRQRIHLAREPKALSATLAIIESIAEDLHHKRALLQMLEAHCSPRTILASNTAALSITALASGMLHPERLVGMHFFVPASVIPLVEVVRGLHSAPWVVEKSCRLLRSWGKRSIRVKNAPGFVVNRVARPFFAEALRFLVEGGSDVATIDCLLRESGGFAMGPFELMDLIGIDHSYRINCILYAGLHQDPRYRPCWLQREYVDAGYLGCRTKQGFYHYPRTSGSVIANTAGRAAPPRRIVVEGALGPAEALVELASDAGIEVVRGSGSGLIHVQDTLLAFSRGLSATELATRFTHPDLVLVDLARDYTTCKRVGLAAADQASLTCRASAAGFFQALGKEVSWIQDLPGLLLSRTLASLVNEASSVVAQQVCSARDVDRAMELGMHFPQGPLSWGQSVGLKAQVKLLDNLERSYGDGAYRVCPLLRRKVFGNTLYYE